MIEIVTKIVNKILFAKVVLLYFFTKCNMYIDLFDIAFPSKKTAKVKNTQKQNKTKCLGLRLSGMIIPLLSIS